MASACASFDGASNPRLSVNPGEKLERIKQLLASCDPFWTRKRVQGVGKKEPVGHEAMVRITKGMVRRVESIKEMFRTKESNNVNTAKDAAELSAQKRHRAMMALAIIAVSKHSLYSTERSIGKEVLTEFWRLRQDPSYVLALNRHQRRSKTTAEREKQAKCDANAAQAIRNQMAGKQKLIDAMGIDMANAKMTKDQQAAAAKGVLDHGPVQSDLKLLGDAKRAVAEYLEGIAVGRATFPYELEGYMCGRPRSDSQNPKAEDVLHVSIGVAPKDLKDTLNRINTECCGNLQAVIKPNSKVEMKQFALWRPSNKTNKIECQRLVTTDHTSFSPTNRFHPISNMFINVDGVLVVVKREGSQVQLHTALPDTLKTADGKVNLSFGEQKRIRAELNAQSGFIMQRNQAKHYTQGIIAAGFAPGPAVLNIFGRKGPRIEITFDGIGSADIKMALKDRLKKLGNQTPIDAAMAAMSAGTGRRRNPY